MNRSQLQQLAEERARDAEALLNAGQWSGAYYLAGYAVECGLKACIAKRTNQHDYPDKELAQRCYTHKIEVLVEVAELVLQRKADVTANPVLGANWSIVKDWDEKARYQLWTEALARKLYVAVTDTTNGGAAMDQGPLVTDEIDAGAELVREFDRYEPVEVAFWLKASDEEHRYLYIASERIDGTNIDVAYGEVLRLADKMQSPYLDPFRVKLVGSDDPLAKAAVEINRRFPGRTPARLGGKSFGGLTVDDVYVYPSPLPVAVS